MFKTSKFQKKIILFNAIAFSVVLLIMFSVFYSYWSSTAKTKTLDNLQTVSEVKARQLDYTFYTLDRIALQLSTNSYVMNDVFASITPLNLSYNYFLNNRSVYTEITSMMTSYILKHNTSSRLCLYNEYNDFVFTGDMLDYNKAEEYINSIVFNNIQKQFNNGASRVIIAPRVDPLFYEATSATPSMIMSVIREIKNYNPTNPPTIGYVEVQFTTEQINDLFSDLDSSTSFYIIDAQGQPFFSNHTNSKTDILTQEALKGTSSSSFSFAKDNYSISVSSIEEFDYKLILMQENNYSSGIYISFALLLIFIFILVISGIITTEYIVIRRLTSPLNDMHEMVQSVDVQNLDLNLSLDDNIDEIQQLNSAFNEMLQKLKISIDELIVSRTGELRSHMFALQAQMNPHFIHNTLTVISSIADEYDALEIETICSKLSQIIKYSASYEQTQATLNDELTHCANYLELMKVRYEDRLSYSFSIDETCESIMVPKLILQPLVENCFKHGLKHVAYPWEINVSISRSSTHWQATIQDNGIGFSDTFLTEFKQLSIELNSINTSELYQDLHIGGLCVKNIYARLRLLYQQSMIFDLYNGTHDSGAIITIGGLIND